MLPSLVLVDLHLRDGPTEALSLAKRFRQIAPSLPVIFMCSLRQRSPAASSADSRFCMCVSSFAFLRRRLVSGFVTKPVKPANLFRLLLSKLAPASESGAVPSSSEHAGHDSPIISMFRRVDADQLSALAAPALTLQEFALDADSPTVPKPRVRVKSARCALC